MRMTRAIASLEAQQASRKFGGICLRTLTTEIIVGHSVQTKNVVCACVCCASSSGRCLNHATHVSTLHMECMFSTEFNLFGFDHLTLRALGKHVWYNDSQLNVMFPIFTNFIGTFLHC